MVDDVEASIARLLKAGAQLVGQTGGAALGGAVGGIPGAMAGAAAGTIVGDALRRVGADIEKRVLAPRERMRVGSAFWYAESRVRQLLFEDRRNIRDDGFFESDARGGRSAAEEVVEGVLLVAAREYEESKVPYIGYLYANVAFSAYDRALVARLLRYAGDLSFRELCLLSLVARKAEFDLPSEDSYSNAERQLTWEQWGLRHDLSKLGLAKDELIFPDTSHAPPGTRIPPTYLRSPASQILAGPGVLLYELMSLDRLPADELNRMAQLFSAYSPPP